MNLTMVATEFMDYYEAHKTVLITWAYDLYPEELYDMEVISYDSQ